MTVVNIDGENRSVLSCAADVKPIKHLVNFCSCYIYPPVQYHTRQMHPDDVSRHVGRMFIFYILIFRIIISAPNDAPAPFQMWRLD